MREIEPGILQTAIESIVLVLEIPRCATAEEILSSVSGSNPSALPISRAALRLRYVMTFAVMAAPRCSVALVDILDDTFTLVAAGKIEIDIRPLPALFGKETFKEQFHADRIDRRDAERVADGAIGGRAAPLNKNVLLAAKADEIPDDKEVSGELEFFDELEFAFDLAACSLLQICSARP